MVPEAIETRHPVTPAVSRIQATHQRIRRDIETLSELEKASEIRTIADELVELLTEHFNDEERPGGLFDELESLRPVIDPQLAFLREEHREIMQALRDLQAQIRNAEAVHQQGEFEQREDHIRVSTRAFVQLIHHHERIESRLVSETYYTEEGGRG
jgi:prefoldin subunit 5